MKLGEVLCAAGILLVQGWAEPQLGIPDEVTEGSKYHVVPVKHIKASDVARMFGGDAIGDAPLGPDERQRPYHGQLFELPPGIEELGAYVPHNTLLIRGEQSAVDEIMDFVRMIDVPKGQIRHQQIEVNFHVLAMPQGRFRALPVYARRDFADTRLVACGIASLGLLHALEAEGVRTVARPSLRLTPSEPTQVSLGREERLTIRAQAEVRADDEVVLRLTLENTAQGAELVKDAPFPTADEAGVVVRTTLTLKRDETGFVLGTLKRQYGGVDLKPLSCGAEPGACVVWLIEARVVQKEAE